MSTAPQPAVHTADPAMTVDVYKVQCALLRIIPGALSLDGAWGPQTKATLDTYLAGVAQPPDGSLLWYNVPARGAALMQLSPSLVVSLFASLRQGECVRPAGPATSIPAQVPAQESTWGWWVAGAALAVVVVGGAAYYGTRRRRSR